MLERQHLIILRAVKETGSVTKASEKLCLTQPAITHAIKKLEGLLDYPLWQKDGRNIKLTNAGEYLLTVANRLLPQFEHAEEMLGHIAKGERGTLRIGMECHPCYQWLLKVVSPYLQAWPDVDVDVKQKFQFAGIGALFAHEIDILVTPDPLLKKGLSFTPVFAYEQVLVVAKDHALAQQSFAKAKDLTKETLISYPVDPSRLDIYSEFLTPAGVVPRKHKNIEATEIILQLVAAGRGVAALPKWLVEQNQDAYGIKPVRLGEGGIHKSIYLGCRSEDAQIAFLQAFIELAQTP